MKLISTLGCLKGKGNKRRDRMEFSEIIVILLVYSSMITFLLLPFQSGMDRINQQKSQRRFAQIFKRNLSEIIFHKKAILALVLLALTLYYVWAAYASTEYHFNAHSGYPPLSTKLNAITSMIGVFLYTVLLTLVIALLKTLKKVKTLR